jgi:hypothetical protein
LVFFQNRHLRAFAINSYRVYAHGVFFLPGPRIFLNSVPKAGTHFLRTLLTELPWVMLSGVHIRMWHAHRADVPMSCAPDFCLDPDAFGRRLRAAHGGQIVTAHLPWRPEAEPVLTDLGVKTIFLIRDPRDIVVSQLHYMLGLRRHRLHKRMSTGFASDRERLMACITGAAPRAGRDWIPAIDLYLDESMGWLRCSDVHVTRFEDLIGARGGGDAQRQRNEIKAIAAHLGRPLDDPAVDRIVKRVANRKSFTFRKGRIGDWRNHFTEEHKAVFKERAGKHLIQLGYEAGLDW